MELQDEGKTTKRLTKWFVPGMGYEAEDLGVAEQIYQASERISDGVAVLERASKTPALAVCARCWQVWRSF